MKIDLIKLDELISKLKEIIDESNGEKNAH